jgi:hypothetical protein
MSDETTRTMDEIEAELERVRAAAAQSNADVASLNSALKHALRVWQNRPSAKAARDIQDLRERFAAEQKHNFRVFGEMRDAADELADAVGVEGLPLVNCQPEDES